MFFSPKRLTKDSATAAFRCRGHQLIWFSWLDCDMTSYYVWPEARESQRGSEFFWEVGMLKDRRDVKEEALSYHVCS